MYQQRKRKTLARGRFPNAAITITGLEVVVGLRRYQDTEGYWQVTHDGVPYSHVPGAIRFRWRDGILRATFKDQPSFIDGKQEESAQTVSINLADGSDVVYETWRIEHADETWYAIDIRGEFEHNVLNIVSLQTCNDWRTLSVWSSRPGRRWPGSSIEKLVVAPRILLEEPAQRRIKELVEYLETYKED